MTVVNAVIVVTEENAEVGIKIVTVASKVNVVEAVVEIAVATRALVDVIPVISADTVVTKAGAMIAGTKEAGVSVSRMWKLRRVWSLASCRSKKVWML